MALYKWSVRLAGIGSFPDQIQYLTQAEYDNLSEEEKMNGTTYGITWTAETNNIMDSLNRWISHEPLENWTGWTTIDIPEWANIIIWWADRSWLSPNEWYQSWIVSIKFLIDTGRTLVFYWWWDYTTYYLKVAYNSSTEKLVFTKWNWNWFREIY